MVTEIPYQVNKIYLLQKSPSWSRSASSTASPICATSPTETGCSSHRAQARAVPKVVLKTFTSTPRCSIASVSTSSRSLTACRRRSPTGRSSTLRRTPVRRCHPPHPYELERAKARRTFWRVLSRFPTRRGRGDLRRSRSVETARNNLMKAFKLSERQRRRSWTSRLQRLTAWSGRRSSRSTRTCVIRSIP